MYYIPSDILEGSVHKSSFSGEFKVISYTGCNSVKVEFISTGTVRVVNARSVRSGKIKDDFAPRVYGVGFFGDGKYGSRSDEQAYKRWSDMFKRCYSEDYQRKKPTYKGCTVCKDWHNFQVFAEWFYQNFKDGLHLDKDTLVKENKIYSPETCVFISSEENARAATENRMYQAILIDQYGKRHEVLNQAMFCRDNDIDPRAINAVIKGKRNSHKGWKVAK